MAGFTARIALDPATLREIARVAEWDAILSQNMIEAQTENVHDLERFAVDWMWTHFRNPTGHLEGAFEFAVDGPWQAQLTNSLPYAVRRNYGFSGKTDALGRTYTNDPGILWAENAVKNAIPYVERNVLGAINRTITGISTP